MAVHRHSINAQSNMEISSKECLQMLEGKPAYIRNSENHFTKKGKDEPPGGVLPDKLGRGVRPTS